MKISLNTQIITALSALAALAVLGYLTQSYHSHTADNNAAILNLAGRQRMLATRAAYFSSQLAIYRGNAARQEEIRHNLLLAVEKMDAEHQVLAHDTPEFTADPAVRRIYFDAPAELDRLTGEYIAAARAVAQGQANSAGPGDPGFDRVAQMVTPVVELTNEAVKHYEVSAERRIGRLRMMEIAGLLTMLAGLAMTWLAIFRPMARRIAQDVRELEAANAELAQGNAMLARQKTELERSNRELDDFAYIASHDLKEPLRGIHNYSTFLLEDYGSRLDEEGKRYLNTLLRLTQRLESLVDTLLHYSRLGRTQLDREDCDLAGVLAEVLDSITLMIRETHAEIQIESPLPRVACNRVMVGELLHNLVVNGLKYNDSAEKKIGIGCVPGATETVYYVRDNGIGIPEKHLESIFRIFKRLHGRDKYGGGTGAGLTIVKKIVERHGGKIWVESQPGAGSTFYFTLEGADSDKQPIEHADSPRRR